MLTIIIPRAGARVRAAGNLLWRAIRRRMERRATFAMLHLDDRMLHDIGLSRADIVACLSSPQDPSAFFEQRRSSRRAIAPRDAALHRIAA